MSTQVADRSSNTKEASVGLCEMLHKLDQAQMPTIDFDQLKEQAQALLVAVEATTSIEQELGILRGDYKARIAGMLKAVAAVSRRPRALEGVLIDIEQLEPLDAESLILAYGRAAARFRDTFRASFVPAGASNPTVKVQEYK